ncbi:MAG: type II secretion system protein [Deferribacteres bacterium]|nr:type II secretion system protein [Deferribacteres bacterium]
MKNKGFTFIELLIILAMAGIVATMFFGLVVNNRGATERRAFAGAVKFATGNNITVKRISCAGDSNRDGYGTCAISTEDNQRIMLQCPTDYFDVEWFGASGCKEVFQDFNFTIR